MNLNLVDIQSLKCLQYTKIILLHRLLNSANISIQNIDILYKSDLHDFMSVNFIEKKFLKEEFRNF